MQVFKFFILTIIWGISSYIGILFSKKYSGRVQELREIKNTLNIIETKIRFTYEPLPDIFNQISTSTKNNIGNIFELASQKMNNMSVKDAWEYGIENATLNLNEEDKSVLKELGKLLR